MVNVFFPTPAVADSSIYFSRPYCQHNHMDIANITKQILLYMYNIVRGRFLRHYLNTIYDKDDIHDTTTF
jgi:hypothetical protein